MGLKPWKINTVLSLDGFRMCIAAISSKGKKLSLQSAMQFVAGPYWNGYVKRLENLVEKVSKILLTFTQRSMIKLTVRRMNNCMNYM